MHSRATTMPRMNPVSRDAFLQSLAETVAWCSTRWNPADPNGSLRTRELEPPRSTATDAGPVGYPPPPAYVKAETDRQIRQVEGVIAARKLALRTQAEPPPRPSLPLEEGRLLVHDTGISLGHGVLEFETRGYFSDMDTPPWDTWVAALVPGPEGLYGIGIVTWVPRDMTDAVGRALPLEVCGICEWLDEAWSDGGAHHPVIPEWLRDYARRATS